MFVPASHFHLSLPLQGKAGAYFLALLTKIRLGWSENTLAYYDVKQITTIKSFIVQAPGETACLMKIILQTHLLLVCLMQYFLCLSGIYTSVNKMHIVAVAGLMVI